MADELVPGQVVADRYQVETRLGTGGMAEVYKVRHVDLGSAHAMKVLAWSRPQLAERFEREGRIQATLNHPNVVKVTDLVRFDGQVALVMDFVDGPSLEDLLSTHGALPPADALTLFVPVLAAVAAAHDQGVWHRDLKPANVLLARTASGFQPMVSDFGIAKVVQEEIGRGTKTGMAMGTPGYMAPEQVRDSSSVDARADVFALGAILYELYTGARAFADENGELSYTSTLDRDPPWLTTVDPAIAGAIQKALAREREERFPDCRAFAAALGVANDPLFSASERRPAASSGVPVSESVRRTGERLSTFDTRAPSGRARPRWVVPLGIGLMAFGGLGMVALAAVALTMFRQPSPGAEARVATPALPVPAPVRIEPTVPEPAPQVAPAAPPRGPVPAPVAVAEVVEPPPASVDPAPMPAAVIAPAPAPILLPAPSEPAPVAEAPFDPMKVLAGRWTGEADGKPFELRFIGASTDGILQADGVLIAGVNRTKRALTGSYDQGTGALMLTADDGSVFRGVLQGASITGTYTGRAEGRALPWSVGRN